MGGLFRLGFGKLLYHVETPNPFHPQCSQETTKLPLLLMVHVVKMLLPCLFSSSPLHPPPTVLLLFSLMFASPVLPSPASSLLCSACLHLAVQFTCRVCRFFSSSNPVARVVDRFRRYMCAYML